MDKVALPHAEPAAYCTAIFPKREKLSLSLSLSLSLRSTRHFYPGIKSMKIMMKIMQLLILQLNKARLTQACISIDRRQARVIRYR